MKKIKFISRIILAFFIVCLVITIAVTLASNDEKAIALPGYFGTALLVSAILSILVMLFYFCLELREQWKMSGFTYLGRIVKETLCMWVVFWGMSFFLEHTNEPAYALAMAVSIQIGSKAIGRIFRKDLD
jgi:predicted permease